MKSKRPTEGNWRFIDFYMKQMRFIRQDGLRAMSGSHELCDNDGRNLRWQYLVTFSYTHRRPTDDEMSIALEQFDMIGAEEHPVRLVNMRAFFKEVKNDTTTG